MRVPAAEKRLLPILSVTLFAVMIPAVADEDANEDDGVIDLRELPADEAWTGSTLQIALDMLNLHVMQQEYDNPGPHVMKFSALLFRDHDEQHPIPLGKFTEKVEMEEERLLLAAIIHETDDTLSVRLRTPKGDVVKHDSQEYMPTQGRTQKSRMRTAIWPGVRTPIYAYGRTDSRKQEMLYGRSDSHAVARFEWIIIIYAEITPIESKD